MKTQEEKLYNWIYDIMKDMEQNSHDQPVIFRYCKGRGGVMYLNALAAISCDDPDCKWCRQVEQLIKEDIK